MATLTTALARTNVKWLSSYLNPFVVANAVTIPYGAYCMLPGTGGDTANRGYLDNYQIIATAIFAGMAVAGSNPGDQSVTNTVVGNTALTPLPAMSCDLGAHILVNYPVTGASAQTDVGKPAYLANNNDVTLTSPLSNSTAIGRIVYYASASSENVLFYGMIGSDTIVY